MFCITRITLSLVLLSFLYSTTVAQVKQSNLNPLLPANEQQRIKKAEILIGKGKGIETEADKIKNSGSGDKEMAKNEKKYNLKRLEASQFYQKGYYDLFIILKDNIADFWKKNKSNSKILADLKNKEDKANELFRKAKSLRKVADDLAYPDEKLVKILEAEDNEKEAIETMIKVLYAYLNNPIAYDVLKQQDLKAETEETNKVDEATKIDSTVVTQKDSIVMVKSMPVAGKKDSVVYVKSKKQIPLSSPEDSTIQLQQVIVVANEDTTKKAINPPILKVDSQAENIKNRPESEPNTNIISNKDTSSLYNMVSINEDQVDMFNKFLQTEYPKDYENYIIDFQKMDYGNVDSMKSAWYKYLYADKETPPTSISSSSSPKDSVIIAVNDIKTAKNASSIAKTTSSSYDKQKITKNVTQPITSQKEGKESMVPTEPATGFVFRVQISACRIPLDSESQKSVYNGELGITELNEDKWYKYAIGEFATYKKARELRDKVNIPGAFVIAYLNGKRIKILTAMTGHSEYSRMSAPESSHVADLIFKVQISASKVPLNKKYIENIYSGSYVVNEIKEDGWYKYVITIGNSFKEAKRIVEAENIPGAFITADYHGKRIELKEALRLLRKSR